MPAAPIYRPGERIDGPLADKSAVGTVNRPLRLIGSTFATRTQSGHQPQNKMIDRRHTRDQRLLTAPIGFRPADPIRGPIIGVLSKKQVQLGRMFGARGAYCRAATPES
jgi:hypothetical protein